MSLLLTGATIIDAVADAPREGHSIWIEGGRIKAIGPRDKLGAPKEAKVVDARGKYVIPGLMNANVHLISDVSLENLVRHYGRYEDLIAEAAQVALKNGFTTVFDTWGPRRPLMSVRDSINAGKTIGSRIFCAGNIIGFDGPFSPDFVARAVGVATPALVDRVNAIWVENVGRHLMWQPPERVAAEVRAYIGKGIDFIKYASNEHGGPSVGAFLAFSPHVQAAIVEEGHRAGLMVQAHTMSVEGLRLAVEAGCDLVQHANITGPVPIPEATLELLARRKTAVVVFPWTQRGLDWIVSNASETERILWSASDVNARAFIRCGARILLANDGALYAPERATEPGWNKCSVAVPEDDGLFALATGHFAWFRAMEEKGLSPMEILRAATRNIAVAYRKDQDFGTLEPGRVADLLVLEKNPLEAAANYRSIQMIFKDGALIDRDALPFNPILTKPLAPSSEEEEAYIPFYPRARGGHSSAFPCSACRFNE